MDEIALLQQISDLQNQLAKMKKELLFDRENITTNISPDTLDLTDLMDQEKGFTIERMDKFARLMFNANEIKMQTGDGAGNYTDSIYFDTVNKKYIFDGTLSVAALEAISAEIDVVVSNTVIVSNLYSTKAVIAELTVDSIDTNDKIQRYLDSDTTDFEYMKMYDNQMYAILAEIISPLDEEQIHNKGGENLYWIDGEHLGTTTDTNEFPVMAYRYNDKELLRVGAWYEEITTPRARTLDNPNAYGTSENDYFGMAVAMTSNYCIVGAYGEDDEGGEHSGKAYIFSTITGDLLHTLDNPNAYGTSENDYFGIAVGITDNYCIVGASDEDDVSGNASGKAYIFSTITGDLLYTLNNPNPYGTSTNDWFGIVVSITDNYCVVGSSEDDEGGSSSGKAYIFDTTTGDLLHTLDNPNAYGTSTNDFFGNSVAITDLHCMVGAYNEDDASGNNSGKVYIFDTVTGDLLHTLDNPDTSPANDYFGTSIGLTDTYCIVGAPNEMNIATEHSGKAYIFSTITGELLYTLDNPNLYDAPEGDWFGGSVAINDIYCIVGSSHKDDANGSNSGKVYVFNTVTGDLIYTVNNPNIYGTSEDDFFGEAIGIADNYFVAGVQYDGANASGKAHIFSLMGGTSGRIILENSDALKNVDIGSYMQPGGGCGYIKTFDALGRATNIYGDTIETRRIETDKLKYVSELNSNFWTGGTLSMNTAQRESVGGTQTHLTGNTVSATEVHYRTLIDSCDAILKDDIRLYDEVIQEKALDLVMATPVYQYKRIDENDRMEIGFIAQESPDLMTNKGLFTLKEVEKLTKQEKTDLFKLGKQAVEDNIKRTDESKPIESSINTNQTVVLLWKAIQELKTELDQLKKI